MHYRILQRNNQIYEILGMYCYAFTALTIGIAFKQPSILPSNSEIVSIYFPIKFKNESG